MPDIARLYNIWCFIATFRLHFNIAFIIDIVLLYCEIINIDIIVKNILICVPLFLIASSLFFPVPVNNFLMDFFHFQIHTGFSYLKALALIYVSKYVVDSILFVFTEFIFFIFAGRFW